MDKITEQEINDYIAVETPWGFTGSREDARRFIQQRKHREAGAPAAPPKTVAHAYEDSYGEMRWSDTKDPVTKSPVHGGR